jgi:hypothetical protein
MPLDVYLSAFVTHSEHRTRDVKALQYFPFHYLYQRTGWITLQLFLCNDHHLPDHQPSKYCQSAKVVTPHFVKKFCFSFFILSNLSLNSTHIHSYSTVHFKCSWIQVGFAHSATKDFNTAHCFKCTPKSSLLLSTMCCHSPGQTIMTIRK